MEQEYLTIKEAAVISRMSESWWRQRIFKREIRFFKVGSRVLIPSTVIEDLFANAIIEPTKPTHKNQRANYGN